MYVRPHLEYAGVSWSPWLVQDKEVLERVQRRAIGMVTNLRGGTYEERLKEAIPCISIDKLKNDLSCLKIFVALLQGEPT